MNWSSSGIHFRFRFWEYLLFSAPSKDVHCISQYYSLSKSNLPDIGKCCTSCQRCSGYQTKIINLSNNTWSLISSLDLCLSFVDVDKTFYSIYLQCNHNRTQRNLFASRRCFFYNFIFCQNIMLSITTLGKRIVNMSSSLNSVERRMRKPLPTALILSCTIMYNSHSLKNNENNILSLILFLFYCTNLS